MCTVTFIPGKNGILLTSNRDEHIHRGIALYPQIYPAGPKKLLYPKDSKAGGTWFISNEYGEAGILLNGAEHKHVSSPPYRKSRGSVLPDIFEADNPGNALQQYDLQGIENFTIVLWFRGTLLEFNWNGTVLKKREHSAASAHIWSSVTLYNEQMITERHAWFYNWISGQPAVTQADIVNFHRTTHVANKEYGLLIDRADTISTTSITSVNIEQAYLEIRHCDLLQNKEVSQCYSLKPYSGFHNPLITASDTHS